MEGFCQPCGGLSEKAGVRSRGTRYDEAIRVDPNLEAARNGRCWTRAILGALQAALEDCNKALQLRPDSAATYDSRGLII